MASGNSKVKDTLTECDSNENLKTPEGHFPKVSLFPGFGIFCGISAAFLYSLMTLFVKQLEDIHPVQTTLTRSYAQFLLLMPVLGYKREVNILGPKPYSLMLWLQGFLGASAAVFQYSAISKLPLGDAVTITYLSLVFTPLLARVILKESLTAFDIIFAAVALTGVVLISQPTFIFPVVDKPPGSDIGILFAVISALCHSSLIIILRSLRDCFPVLNMVYFSFCAAAVTTVLLAILNGFSWPCLHELPYLFSMGPLGVGAQLLLLFTIQNERAGTAGILKSLQIIFVYVFQVTILKDIPTPLNFFGAMLVFSSSVGIGMRKLYNRRKRRTEKNQKRRAKLK